MVYYLLRFTISVKLLEHFINEYDGYKALILFGLTETFINRDYFFVMNLYLPAVNKNRIFKYKNISKYALNKNKKS